MRTYIKQLFIVVIALITVLAGWPAGQARAADLNNRSVTIGTSTPSATTSYRFRFDIPSVNTVGSIVIEFCQTSPLYAVTCVLPSGFNASAATLTSQTGEVGFSIDPSSTNNTIVLTRSPSLTSIGTARYNFSGIVNQDFIGTSYIRVATHASTDGSGPRIDSGGLAYSTAYGVSVDAYVPPYLTFCVGVTVAGDCSSATGQFLGFGELTSNAPRYLTSQYAGATNDPGGFSASVTGVTMTSGSNVIPALASPTPSFPGTSQFGMNVRSNTNPGVGADPSGLGTSMPTSDYSQANLFTFKNNQVVSASNLSTDFNLFTVTYLVNVRQGQAPGVYNTTLTYIAVAAF